MLDHYQTEEADVCERDDRTPEPARDAGREGEAATGARCRKCGREIAADEPRDVARAWDGPCWVHLACVQPAAAVPTNEHIEAADALIAELFPSSAPDLTRRRVARVADLLAAREATAHAAGVAEGRAGTLAGLIVWVEGRWEAEVAHRPVQNIHRRTLDTTWTQMRRHLHEALAGDTPAPGPPGPGE